MDEYNVNQNDPSLRKHKSVIQNCDLTTDDEAVSHMDPGYSRNDEMLLVNSLVDNDVTAYLASSGMAGIAAATAISSSRTRNKSYAFETIPAVRKRQSTRLLRKLQSLIEEYCVRVGQQAVVLVCNPRVSQKPSHHLDSPTSSSLFKVYGSSPLEQVVRNMRPILVQELDNALHNIQLIHEQTGGSSALWNSRENDVLPPLMVDGIPTPLEKMTQAQLRAFIPVMLKFSTSRGKPGWGRPQSRPPWWPDEVPWANVRSDVRTPEEKASVSWTAALKKVVRQCYEYHGCEALLADYSVADQSQLGQMASTQILDIDASGATQNSQFMIGHPPSNDVVDHSHSSMYHLMHMPTSEGIGNQPRYESYPTAPSYSFKTHKDGSISIVRVEDQKTADAQTLEAAAALEEYNQEAVKYQTGDDIAMGGYGNGGEMVSIPADTMMQLDNDANAVLYQIITNTHHNNQMGHSSDPNHVSDNM